MANPKETNKKSCEESKKNIWVFFAIILTINVAIVANLLIRWNDLKAENVICPNINQLLTCAEKIENRLESASNENVPNTKANVPNSNEKVPSAKEKVPNIKPEVPF